MATRDPLLAAAGAPGPSVLDAAHLLDHLLDRLEGRDGPPLLLALLDCFERRGLAHLAASWVSTAPNHAITAAEVRTALGEALLGQLAHASGLTTAAAASALAVVLPHVIDRLTPAGVLPRPSDLRPPLVTRTPAASA